MHRLKGSSAGGPLIPRGFGNILHHCQRCKYDWSSYRERPSACPRCCTHHWDTPEGTRFIPVFPCVCLRCGHKWDARKPNPAKCTQCSQFFWYKERSEPASEVFDKLVWQETDACIIWPLSTISDGYGRLRVGKKIIQTHRLAYEKRIKEIPEGLKVCHKCDNPPCMNYRHLFLGTVLDNKLDEVNKKRNVHGERHPHAKLTEAQVLDIRARYVLDLKNRAPRQKLLAIEFGVGQDVISAIVRRETWKHI